MVDMVVHRSKLRETLGRLLGLLRQRGPAGDLVPLAVDTPDAYDTV